MAHCFFKKVGGTSTGSGNYAHGTFTTSTSATTKVTLGFKPKSLAIRIATNYMYFYDDAVSTTQFKYAASNANMSNVNLGNTSNNRLGTIDNDGFTFNKTSAVYTGYYSAVG